MQAGVAKLETSLSFVGDKLELKLYGFNDKLPILLSKILKLSKTFMPNIDRFKVHLIILYLLLQFINSPVEFYMLLCLYSSFCCG